MAQGKQPLFELCASMVVRSAVEAVVVGKKSPEQQLLLIKRDSHCFYLSMVALCSCSAEIAAV